MKLKRSLAFIVLAAIAATAGACTTPTTIEGAWRDPNFGAAPLHKIMVVARVGNETNRRTLEDDYVATLSQHGVQAMASYHAFQEPHPDRNVVRQYLVSEGYDGALVTMYKGTRTQVYVSPDIGFYGYYGDYWNEGYYTATDQFVKAETSLWDPRTGKLIWTATSETENPSSASDAMSSLVSRITKSLTDAHLIAPSTAVSYTPNQQHIAM